MSDCYSKICSDRLQAGGHIPEQPWQQRQMISISERGTKYSAPVALPNKSASFQIDGGVIKDGVKCDKLVIALHEDTCSTVFVELKGKDIIHAIDQLECMLEHRMFAPYSKNPDEVRARIITCGCGPASAAKNVVERAKIRFRRNFNCDLRILKSGQPDKMI